MVEQARVCGDGLRNPGRRRLPYKTLALIGLAIAAWLAGCLRDLSCGSAPPAVAAEVDAIGAPAPVGFADIVERVKPAVVGVRVKIEGMTPSERTKRSRSAPFPPGSPFDRFFRHFGIPLPDLPLPSQASPWAPGSLSPATAMS